MFFFFFIILTNNKRLQIQSLKKTNTSDANMDQMTRTMNQTSVLKELKNMGIDRSAIVQSYGTKEEVSHNPQEAVSKETLQRELLELRKLFDQKLNSLYADLTDAKRKFAEAEDFKQTIDEMRLELQKVSKDLSLVQDSMNGRRPAIYQQPQQQMYPQYQQPMYQQPVEQPQYVQPQMQQAPPQMQQPMYQQPMQQSAPKEDVHPYQQYLNTQAPPKPVQTKPIDRNGVAPSDVALDKYFNFANNKRSAGMR